MPLNENFLSEALRLLAGRPWRREHLTGLVEGSGRGVITGASTLYDELRRLAEADLGDVPPSGTSLSSLRA